MPSQNRIIRTTKRFDKSFRKCSPLIQHKAKARLEVFMKNPYDSVLRNHALFGDWLGFRSIDVTGDFRIIFCEFDDGILEIVELVEIGNHSQLY